MTSGNVSDEPICFADEEALDRLGAIADLFLVHDRPIETRTDDSVVRVLSARGSPWRRRFCGARAGTCRPRIPLPGAGTSRPLLACGAELKSTFCVAKGARAWVSHHIGDLSNLETLRSFTEGVEHFERLFAVSPEVVAHDLHPEYLSTKYALERDGVELIGVQHHHAHLAACLAEHGERGPAVGAIFDGTGYGLDGTVWGGELLYGDVSGSFGASERCGRCGCRAASARSASRGGWRARGCSRPPATAAASTARWSAASILGPGGRSPGWPQTGLASPHDDERRAPVRRGRGAVRRARRDQLRGSGGDRARGGCDPLERGSYPIELVEARRTGCSCSTRPRRSARSRATSAPASRVGVIAARFHAALAGATVAACARAASADGHRADRAVRRRVRKPAAAESDGRGLDRAGLRVLTPQRLPAGDGGISYGQAAVAARRIEA